MLNGVPWAELGSQREMVEDMGGRMGQKKYLEK